MSAFRLSLIALGLISAGGLTALSTSSGPPSPRAATPRFPPGWEAVAQREEIRPAFSFDPEGGPGKAGAFVIEAGDSVGQHGWLQKAFPVEGGKCYRFQALRQSERVAVPRRSGVANSLHTLLRSDDAGDWYLDESIGATLEHRSGPWRRGLSLRRERIAPLRHRLRDVLPRPRHRLLPRRRHDSRREAQAQVMFNERINDRIANRMV